MSSALKIRCISPGCMCGCFVPGKLSVRLCDSCEHSWISHALDKLGTVHLYNTSHAEQVNSSSVFDIASLILFGTQAVPIQLKILLDRLFSLLNHAEVLQVLHGLGWSYEDYARGYTLQDSGGHSLERWSLPSTTDTFQVMQQFLRFAETKTIATWMIQQGNSQSGSASRPEIKESEIKLFLQKTVGIRNPITSVCNSTSSMRSVGLKSPVPANQTVVSLPTTISTIPASRKLFAELTTSIPQGAMNLGISSPGGSTTNQSESIVVKSDKQLNVVKTKQTASWSNRIRGIRRKFASRKRFWSLVSHSGRNVSCPECSKTFTTRGGFRVHYSGVHMNIKFKCTVPNCERTFNTARSRNRHSSNANPRIHLSKSQLRHTRRTVEATSEFVEKIALLTGSIDNNSTISDTTDIHSSSSRFGHISPDISHTGLLSPNSTGVTSTELENGPTSSSGFIYQLEGDPCNLNNSSQTISESPLHNSDTVTVVMSPQFGEPIPSNTSDTDRIIANSTPPSNKKTSRKAQYPLKISHQPEARDNHDIDCNEDEEVTVIEHMSDFISSNIEYPISNDEESVSYLGKIPANDGPNEQANDLENLEKFVASVEESATTVSSNIAGLQRVFSMNCDSDNSHVGGYIDSGGINNGMSDKDIAPFYTDKSTNGVMCQLCGKAYSRLSCLKQHFKSVHMKETHSCWVKGCSLVFPSKRSRDRHSSNLNLHKTLGQNYDMPMNLRCSTSESAIEDSWYVMSVFADEMESVDAQNQSYFSVSQNDTVQGGLPDGSPVKMEQFDRSSLQCEVGAGNTDSDMHDEDFTDIRLPNVVNETMSMLDDFDNEHHETSQNGPEGVNSVSTRGSTGSSDSGHMPESPGKNTPIRCHVCNKLYSSKSTMRIHFRSVHVREMHSCRIPGCNMMFTSARSRDRHSKNINLHRNLPDIVDLSTASVLASVLNNM